MGFQKQIRLKLKPLEEVVRIVYLANFESIFKYGIMFSAQKRALKIIKRKPYLKSCRNQFSILKKISS